MVTILLQQILDLLKGFFGDFTTWAADVFEKLGFIQEQTENLDDILNDTTNISNNTNSIAASNEFIRSDTAQINNKLTTIQSNSTTIANNSGSIATSAGTAAAFAEDCATNTLNINNRLVTIGSDTTQIRTDSTRLAADVAEIKDTLGLYLYNTIVTEDAEGAICNIDTDLADYLQVLKASIVATEIGSGTKSPSNPYTLGGFSNAVITRSRKNLFDKSKMVISTQRFVKYGVDNYSDTLPNGKFKLQANQAYTFSFSGANSTNFESISVYDEAGTRVAVVYNNNIATFTPASTGAYFLAFAVSAGNWGGTWDNYDIQFEIGSTATTYEPYTATQTTIALGQTVYGGELDCLTGMLKITHAIIKFSDLTWGSSTWGSYTVYSATVSDAKLNSTSTLAGLVCEMYNEVTAGAMYSSNNDAICLNNNIMRIRDNNFATFAEWEQATANCEVVYPLATPFVVDITPIFIKLAKGISNIWSDTGDTALTYRETLKHYLKKQEA